MATEASAETGDEERSHHEHHDVPADFDMRYLDDLLSYQTQKVVVIRDRRLGCLYITLCCLIFIYIILFQIMFANQHFPRKDVRGRTRVMLTHPTKADCDPAITGCLSDFRSLADLPYCEEYTGSHKVTTTKPCIFADRHSIAPNGMLEEHFLVPTRVDSTVQHRDCQPNAPNGYTCDNEYSSNGTTQEAFVADVERFALHISHSYTRFEITGQSVDVKGSYLECEREAGKGSPDLEEEIYGRGRLESCDGKTHVKEIECLRHDCPWLDAESKSFLEQVRRRTSSWIWRARESAASRLADAANLLYPTSRGRTHLVRHTRRGNRSLMRRHMHNRGQYGHHRRRKPLQTLFTIDAMGSARLESPDHRIESEGISALSEKSLEEDENNVQENARGKHDGVWSDAEGDVFTIQKLLDLSGISLDNTKNKDGLSLREAGSVIEIEAYYTNLHPWTSTFGDTHVMYEYRVSQRPAETFSSVVYSQYQPNFPDQRILEQRHGLYIIVKISGEFGKFSLVYCLVLVASAAGIMRFAVVIVDNLAIYCMKMKEVYCDSKYQLTDRVYNMQEDLDALMQIGDLVDDVQEDEIGRARQESDAIQQTMSLRAAASSRSVLRDSTRFSTSGDAGAGGGPNF